MVSGGGCASFASAPTTVNLAPPQADVALTLTDNHAQVMLGRSLNYIIVVSNANGPSTIDATVTDTLPAGLTGGSWVCVPFGGAVCANGFGDTLSDTMTLPIGAQAAYIFNATVVGADASDQLSNSASVTVAAGSTDPQPANNAASDIDGVHIFIDGFEGTPLMVPTPVGNGSDLVSTTLRVDPNLLGGLGLAPVQVAVGRGADGKSLFALELARFGNDTVIRALTADAKGINHAGAWQAVDLEQHLFSFSWQTAAGGADGYLKAGGTNPTLLLLGGSAETDRLVQLWVTVQNATPWLVPMSR